MISRENQHLKARINAVEKRYLELENANLLLKVDLKTEQHMKLEWKENFEKMWKKVVVFFLFW